MKSKKHVHRSYSTEFKLSVLRDMYANNLSCYFTAKKYDILSPQTIVKWIKEFPLDSKSLSLSQEVITKIMSMRTKNELKKAAECPSSNKTEAQKLQEENALLRKALEYSELRNEALMEVLKIGKEEYGLDLLKKAGAKQ